MGADRLADLWDEYAAALARFADALPTGVAEMFAQQVRAPAAMPKWGQVRAAAAWPNWRPDRLRPAALPTTAFLAGLRDDLTALLAKAELPRPARWFGRDPGPLDEADGRRVLVQCRDALAALAAGMPARQVEAFAVLERIAAEIDERLVTSPATHARRLADLLTTPDARDALAAPVITLLAFTGAPDGDPVPVALAVADGVVALANASGTLAELPPDRAAWLDQLLDALRAWAAAFDVTLLPAAWSFVTPPADLGDGVERAAVYRPAEPRGCVVRLKGMGAAGRPAVVSVSAGPAPAGLAELESLVADADDPASRHLRERLRGWRTASLDGCLETAAVELFVEFWDVWRPQLADGAAFAERLAAVLREGFGLSPFYPANFQDRPAGWVQATDAGRMATGRVREVARPGLLDRAGELRVPARVVVD